MFRINIRLRDTNDVRSFVNITNRYPFQIALRQDRALIDAKSLMGIISLDHRKPITVEAYGNHANALHDELERYAV